MRLGPQTVIRPFPQPRQPMTSDHSLQFRNLIINTFLNDFPFLFVELLPLSNLISFRHQAGVLGYPGGFDVQCRIFAPFFSLFRLPQLQSVSFAQYLKVFM